MACHMGQATKSESRLCQIVFACPLLSYSASCLSFLICERGVTIVLPSERLRGLAGMLCGKPGHSVVATVRRLWFSVQLTLIFGKKLKLIGKLKE